MSAFMAILRMQLKSKYGLSELRTNRKNDKKAYRKQVGIFVLIAFSIIVLVGTYALVVYAMTEGLMSAGADIAMAGSIVLVYGFLAVLLMILFFGLFIVLGTLFFAKDGAFLATLPVPQRTVFLSKLAMVYISELGVALAMLAPVVAVYGVMAGMGVAYYLKAIVIWLFVPAIPLLIASLISSLFMGVIGRMRHRNLFAILGGFLGLVLMVAIQVGANMFARGLDDASLMRIIMQPNGLVDLMGSSFPPSAWAVKALITEGLGGVTHLLGFIGLSVALLAVVILIANRIYYRGALSQLETLKRMKKVERSAYVKGIKSPVHALFSREWKSVLRSPSYAMNSLTGIVIGFVVMILPALGMGASGGQFKAMADMLGQGDQGIVTLGLAGVMALFGSINPAAATALSREGSMMALAGTFPVPFGQQVKAKFWFGYSIGAMTVLSTGAGALIAYNLDIANVLLAAGIALIFLVATTALSLEIDLLHPRFNWKNENEAIKQNMNSLYAMLLSFVLVAGLGALVFLLYGTMDILLLGGLIALISAALCAFSLLALKKTAGKAVYEL